MESHILISKRANVRQLVLCSGGVEKERKIYGKASDMAEGSSGQYPLRLRLAREPCAVQCRVEGAVTRLVRVRLGLGWVFRATVQCRVQGAVARLVKGLGLGLGWAFRATVQCRVQGAVTRLVNGLGLGLAGSLGQRCSVE